MDIHALGSLDQLGDAVDSVAQAPKSGPSLDTFAKPLDDIVGKFDTLARTDNAASSAFSKTIIQQRQMTDVMSAVGNQLQMGGGVETAALANGIGGAYFDLQHTKREIESLGNRNDKASRAQKAQLQQKFFQGFRRFRDEYTTWKQTSYQDWKRRDDAQKKTTRAAAEKLEGARTDLRKMLADNPEDKDLKGLVHGLTDVKKALLRGDLKSITLPGGGKYDPRRGSFKSYLQEWKSAVEQKKIDLAKEEEKKQAEEAAEEANKEAEEVTETTEEETSEETPEAAVARKAAAVEGRAGTERRGTERGAPEIAEAPSPQDRDTLQRASIEAAVARPTIGGTLGAAVGAIAATAGAAVGAKAAANAKPEEKAPRRTRAERAKTDQEKELEKIDAAWEAIGVAADNEKKEDEKFDTLLTKGSGYEAVVTAIERGELKATAHVREMLQKHVKKQKDLYIEPKGGLLNIQTTEKDLAQRKNRVARIERILEAEKEGEEVAITKKYEDRFTKLIDKLEADGKQKLDFKQKWSPQAVQFQQGVEARAQNIRSIGGEAEALEQEIRTNYPGNTAPPDLSSILEKIHSLKNIAAGYSDSLKELSIQLPGGDALKMPELDAQALAKAQQSMQASTASIRASLPIPSPVETTTRGGAGGTVDAVVTGAAGAAAAPLAAIAGAAVAASAAAQAGTVAAANTSLQALGQQAAQVLNQIRSNSMPRPQGGGLQIRPASRDAVRKTYSALTEGLQQAAAAQRDNVAVQDLNFYVSMFAPGVEQDDAELPLDAADGKIFEQWKGDAGVRTIPPAPLPEREVKLSDVDLGFENLLQEANQRESGQPQHQIAPQMRTRATAPRPSPRGTTGAGGGGGATGGPRPAIGSAGPLGSAISLLSQQQRDAFAGQRGADEISALSGDTTLSDDSISQYGTTGPEPVLPTFASYAATGPHVSPPFAGGEETGELITTGEEAERMRILQAQQSATLRQFVGGGAAGGAVGVAGVAAGAAGGAGGGGPRRPGGPAPETEDEEEEEGPEGEERNAIELNSQQGQSRLANKAQEKAKEQLEKQLKNFAKQSGKAASKTASSSIRGVLEGTEVATSETIVPIVMLIVELNVQMLYKYFFKGMLGIGNAEEGIGKSAATISGCLEQSFIEDFATICIDFMLCSNILLMPPLSFCTCPIIIITGVMMGAVTMLGLDKVLGTITNILQILH